ncbi:MAG: ABC transporter permease [Pseudomonadota bacterium]
MEDYSIFQTTLTLIFSGNDDLYQIVRLSLFVSLSAVMVSALVAVPIGAALALFDFFGRRIAIIIFNAFMSVPPVVIGLFVYVMLSRSGPLGVLELLFTPVAMIIAQSIMVFPIMVSLSHRQSSILVEEYRDYFCMINLKGWAALKTLVWEARYQLITVFLAAFGRAISEVGAVMIVGGNIAYSTRVMTSAIALETSKGNIQFALALGLVLVFVAVIVALIAHCINLKLSANAY